MAEYTKLGLAVGRGVRFVMQLPDKSNWEYHGADATFGNPNTPVFWYKPIGLDTYRLVYADMTVEDGVPETDLPEAPETSSGPEIE